MSASELARAERVALCDLLDELGPEQPTLCQGWRTRDLAAHLVVRESRPDAALGVLGGPLASWTERVQNGAAEEPFDKLVRLVRLGPPIWSAFRLPFVEGQANLLEYYIHHEDVRRAQPDWQPRELSPDLTEQLWGRLRPMSRMLLHKAPGGVVARRTDLAPDAGEEAVQRLKGGDPTVTISGHPGEIALVLFGRTAAHVDISGDPQAVTAFREAQLGMPEADSGDAAALAE